MKRIGRAFAIFAVLLALIACAYVFVLPRVLERIRYPVKYEPQIRAASEMRHVPAALIAAIALTESSYRADALSAQGAMGLMQIMPETGMWIAEELGEDASFAQSDLYDAECSLSYGGWYLEFLLNRYRGDVTSTVAAYHAGQNSVDKWRLANADGALVIPEGAPRTRHYVSKVITAYEYYQKVYK